MGYPKPWKIHVEAPCVGESIDIRGLIDPMPVTLRLYSFAYFYANKVSIVSKCVRREKELWIEIDILGKEEKL